MNNTKENLQKEILCLNHRIKQMRKEKLQTDIANIIYNRLLIQKAVLLKKLERTEKSKFLNFIFKNIRKIQGKKLICDTFSFKG
ncbi:MAG: hypothetical protein PHX18_04885 [Candidatus Gastranaerophilales bacterium]|nr:hypothetical protein [Candidatus Gastranaerophilales bacterium]